MTVGPGPSRTWLLAREMIGNRCCESTEVKETFVRDHAEQLIEAARLMSKCVKSGGKILICGNGGSASDSQHMAAELVGRLLTERGALPAIALTADTSNLTAIGNDYGYEFVFSRQVEALARPGDVLVGITTSGNSKNVIYAVHEAHRAGCSTIVLTGGEGGKVLNEKPTIALIASVGQNSCRIQETHIFAIHVMVELMDSFDWTTADV